MKCIAYNDGYKYQLKETYSVAIDIRPPSPIDTDYIKLAADGNLTLKKGYAWDGPSGPTIDTLKFMRGSLVHDALYQLMREGHLDNETYREPADRIRTARRRGDGRGRVPASPTTRRADDETGPGLDEEVDVALEVLPDVSCAFFQVRPRRGRRSSGSPPSCS